MATDEDDEQPDRECYAGIVVSGPRPRILKLVRSVQSSGLVLRQVKHSAAGVVVVSNEQLTRLNYKISRYRGLLGGALLREKHALAKLARENEKVGGGEQNGH